VGKYKVGDRVFWVHSNINSRKDHFKDKKVRVLILERTERTYKILIEGTEITKFIQQNDFESKVLEAGRA
jgi:hypothetical protein